MAPISALLEGGTARLLLSISTLHAQRLPHYLAQTTPRQTFSNSACTDSPRSWRLGE